MPTRGRPKKNIVVQSAGEYVITFDIYGGEKTSYKGDSILETIEKMVPDLGKKILAKSILTAEKEGKKTKGIIFYPRMIKKLNNPIFREIFAKRLTLALQ